MVHEWLTQVAGSERVLEQILWVYPQATLFAVVDAVPPGQRGFLDRYAVQTTFIQKLPLAGRFYRHYLPLMPLAIEQLDLSGFDLVISSSHAVAKGVLTGPDQLHISYIHSPMRYAWDLQHQCLRESGLERALLLGAPRGGLGRRLRLRRRRVVARARRRGAAGSGRRRVGLRRPSPFVPGVSWRVAVPWDSIGDGRRVNR